MRPTQKRERKDSCWLSDLERERVRFQRGWWRIPEGQGSIEAENSRGSFEAGWLAFLLCPVQVLVQHLCLYLLHQLQAEQAQPVLTRHQEPTVQPCEPAGVHCPHCPSGCLIADLKLSQVQAVPWLPAEVLGQSLEVLMRAAGVLSTGTFQLQRGAPCLRLLFAVL